MKRQQGLTVISWIVILAFLGFQGVLALNVIPVYINDASVKSIMTGLETDQTVRDKDARKLGDIIIKRLKINNIYSIKKDNITIKKTKSSYLVSIDYEPRGTLVSNLDYIVTFHHEASIPLK
jgi:hypothetical protein